MSRWIDRLGPTPRSRVRLADDNVVAAHTLRLSQALLEAGHPHTVLPLSGLTHMTPRETVAENLLLLQLDFLRTAALKCTERTSVPCSESLPLIISMP